MDIKELVKNATENAENHGFHDEMHIANKSNNMEYVRALVSQNLLLVVSEVTEAQDGLRRNDYDNFKEELADVFIRMADLCGLLEIDIESEIKKKMEKNKNRPYMHGKQF